MRGMPGVVFLAVFLAAAGCGGSASMPSSNPNEPAPLNPPSPQNSKTLHAEAADSIGDAPLDSRVPVSPDLVHVTVDVSAGNINFVVQFAPGTLDRQNTRVSVLLDTDEDLSTGIRQPDIGADYNIDMAAGTSLASVTKADPAACAAHLSCFNPIGGAPITFAADRMQVTLPLSLLGNDDGRMGFRLSSYVIAAPLTPVVFDFMPDSTLPLGLVR